MDAEKTLQEKLKEKIEERTERVIQEIEKEFLGGRRCSKCHSLMIHSRLAGYQCPRGCFQGV